MKPYPSNSTVRLYMMFTSGRSLAIGVGVIALSTATLVFSGCGETTATEQRPQSASMTVNVFTPTKAQAGETRLPAGADRAP